MGKKDVNWLSAIIEIRLFLLSITTDNSMVCTVEWDPRCTYSNQQMAIAVNATEVEEEEKKKERK